MHAPYKQTREKKKHTESEMNFHKMYDINQLIEKYINQRNASLVQCVHTHKNRTKQNKLMTTRRIVNWPPNSIHQLIELLDCGSVHGVHTIQ